MYVTAGSEAHPMHQKVYDVECVIRRITQKKVWYLHSMDITNNECVWTRQFHKGHLFKNSEEAYDFMRIFLGTERMKECDLFSEYETWSI